jgi:hypothetical protein
MMSLKEYANIIAAVVVLTVVGGFAFAIGGEWPKVAQMFLFAVIIIFVSIFAKKTMAYLLDADIEHSIIKFSQYGFRPGCRLKKEIPAGIIFPLIISLFSLGFFKLPALLSYETQALKRRAAKRFGFYSFTEMTEWHNALIGAAGIVAVLIIAVVTYFLPANFEYLAKIAIYYAFANMLPAVFINTDGTQIFFGSKVLYTALAVITLIFFAYAVIL